MESTKENKLVVMPARSRLSEVLQQAQSPREIFDEELEDEQPRRGARVQQLPIEDIALSTFQVRQTISSAELESLAASIVSKGILQPLLVRAIDLEDERSESFELIAGERRLRAAKLAGLDVVPVLIVPLDDRETLEAAIVENAQREDLNALEEARAYRRLAEEFGMTQRDIAEAVGKHRATISNALRLLQLDERVAAFIENEELSAGHGRALLMLEGALQYRFARKAIEQQLSVHALEKKVARFLEIQADDRQELDEEEERELRRLERQTEKVCDYLGLEKVSMHFDSQGRRKVQLTFPSEASWKRFVSKIRE